MEGNDGVVFIVFSGEQHADALLFLLFFNSVHFGENLLNAVLVIFLNCHLAQRQSVLQACDQACVVFNGGFFLLDTLQYAGGLVGIVPECGVHGLLLLVEHHGVQLLNAQRATQLDQILLQGVKLALGIFQCDNHMRVYNLSYRSNFSSTLYHKYPRFCKRFFIFFPEIYNLYTLCGVM